MVFLKKTLPFILLNIVVSALTVLAVLFIWDRYQQKQLAIQPCGDPQSVNLTAPPEDSEKKQENTPKPVMNTSQPGQIAVSIQLVSGLGDLNLEYILVKNEGSAKISLLDWTLEGAGQKGLSIPTDIQLNPGGGLKIFSKTGADSALAIYLNRQEALWKSGDTVILLDPDKIERARYTIP